jgi:hypothetical protein
LRTHNIKVERIDYVIDAPEEKPVEKVVEKKPQPILEEVNQRLEWEDQVQAEPIVVRL